MEEETKRLENTTVSPSEVNPLIESLGGTPLDNRVSLSELLRRPEITYDALAAVDPERPALSYHVRTKVEVSLKYRGYIEKQLAQIEKFKKLEGQTIPEDIDYMSMEGLRNEAREKLTDIRPVSVGQASRISGVSPADINVLLVQLERMRRKH